MACGNMCFIRLTRLEIACVQHVCDVDGQLSLWLIRHALVEILDKKSYLNTCNFMGLIEIKVNQELSYLRYL